MPDVDTLTNQGKEIVELQFLAGTDTLVFNSLNETLNDVRLDGQPVASVTSDDQKQLTTVILRYPAEIGQHSLSFSYIGRIETKPRGLFIQHYEQPSGTKGVLLTTQMEATDARRMFPCWDEPAFRATFQLTAIVPSAWATISNMPIAESVPRGALVTTTFQPSPKMSSYLIEFTAGDLAELKATSGGTQLGVWALRGQEENGQVALANAQTILTDYEEYFAYPLPLPKLDAIAIPGGFNRAMENWGAIAYPDQALLISPSSTFDSKQTTFNIQAHELAHQWFGDLVTMRWWDDLWLNESFAAWLAAKETDKRQPNWHWWERGDANKERAMLADARLDSHAIQQHVTNELQAINPFDQDMTYNKGQAILRMFEAYLGEEVFRNGVRNYIQAHALSNAMTADLWNAMDAAGGKWISQIAASWLAQPGFPLVTAGVSCGSNDQRTITLTQSRFLLRGSDPNQSTWSVPLQIRIGANGAPRRVLLTEDGHKVAAGRCVEPLSLNADATGFYRVRYDAKTLQTNTKLFRTLPAADRIALLDDQWALVSTGKEPLSSYLALASFMDSDIGVRASEQIEDALSTIEYDARGTAGHDTFAAYARSVIKPAFAALGWDAKDSDTPEVQKLRRRLIQDMGLWGDPSSIAEARTRFAAFLQDHSRLSPDDQGPILRVVARNADAATFQVLHALAKTAQDITEIERFYGALMQVENESLAEQAAQIALSSEIPPQAENRRFQLLTLLAQRHQRLAWTLFREHHDTLLRPLQPFGPLIIARQLPQVFWSGIPLVELETWLRKHVPAGMSSNVDQGLQTMRFKLAEKRALVGAAATYLRARAQR